MFDNVCAHYRERECVYAAPRERVHFAVRRLGEWKLVWRPKGTKTVAPSLLGAHSVEAAQSPERGGEGGGRASAPPGGWGGGDETKMFAQSGPSVEAYLAKSRGGVAKSAGDVRVSDGVGSRVQGAHVPP